MKAFLPPMSPLEDESPLKIFLRAPLPHNPKYYCRTKLELRSEQHRQTKIEAGEEATRQNENIFVRRPVMPSP